MRGSRGIRHPDIQIRVCVYSQNVCAHLCVLIIFNDGKGSPSLSKHDKHCSISSSRHRVPPFCLFSLTSVKENHLSSPCASRGVRDRAKCQCSVLFFPPSLSLSLLLPLSSACNVCDSVPRFVYKYRRMAAAYVYSVNVNASSPLWLNLMLVLGEPYHSCQSFLHANATYLHIVNRV